MRWAVWAQLADPVKLSPYRRRKRLRPESSMSIRAALFRGALEAVFASYNKA